MKAKEKRNKSLAETSEAKQSETISERPSDSLSRIQQRAYELWKGRGSGEGGAIDDWLQAEAEVNAALASPEADRTREINYQPMRD
ncbi:MAG: DUF2934 domain-containing protein [Acidobacteria bacterium]|nr:DUF2934 domain-containing protein [Acidobacteriota bacterium]